MVEKKVFRIDGMHCTACAMNIDGDLEDTAGIVEARTNYAKQETMVSYDAEKISPDQIISIIRKTGYTVV